MKKRELIPKFIELRALGYTFDELVKEMGVTKVTLLRWSKIYDDDIDNSKMKLMQATVKKIVEKNSDLIAKFADLVVNEYKKGKKGPVINEVILQRFYRRVLLVYARKMKTLSISLNNDGTPKDVVIVWKDEESGDGYIQ